MKEMSFDSDIDTIGDYAFWGCSNLRKVTIWGRNTKVGEGTFDNCPKLEPINRW